MPISNGLVIERSSSGGSRAGSCERSGALSFASPVPVPVSTRASAAQKVSPSKAYFFAAGAVAAALPPLRKVRKNSDDDGSTTITSLFLLKLAL